jgi:enoyl-CoA hydratase/carnithine racemase
MQELINNVVLPDSLKVSRQESVLLVKLDRAHKRNALDPETVQGLDRLFSNVPDWARCAIIYSAGDHFSAGLDLMELKDKDLIEGIWHSRMWHHALESIQYGKVPVISVLHGAVVGGGLELATATHIRVADRTAFYALPEGQRGIYVGGGASVRLPQLIGVARMQDMMLTGRVYDAADGQSIGITQYLVDDNALEKAMELAVKICSNVYVTNYSVMHILPRIQEASNEAGFMMESLIAAISQSTPEAKERLRAFLDGKARKVEKK